MKRTGKRLALPRAARVLGLFFMSSIFAQAIEKEALIVWEKNGTQTAFLLTEKPHVTSTATELTITSPSLTANFPIDKVRRFTIQSYNFPDALFQLIEIGGEETEMTYEGDELILTNVPKKAKVNIYTPSGTAVTIPYTHRDKYVRIPLTELSPGTYIITTGTRSFKIIK